MNPCVIAITLLLCGLSFGAEPDALHFNYRVEGDVSNVKIYVFDDGKRTYLQYEGKDTPILQVNSQDDLVGRTLVMRFEAPYLVVDGTLPCFLLTTSRIQLMIFKSSTKLPECRRVPRATPPEDAPEKILTLQNSPQDEKPSGAPMNSGMLFHVPAQSRLSEALRQFLLKEGYVLHWRSTDDFIIREAYVAYGNTVLDVLTSIERDYDLSAQVKLNAVTIVASSWHP
jgi:hypothetical protein